MRLLFVTDLHDNQWKYDRLLPAAQPFQFSWQSSETRTPDGAYFEPA